MNARSGATLWRVKQMVPVYPAAGRTWVEKLFKAAECGTWKNCSTELGAGSSGCGIGQEEQAGRLWRLVERARAQRRIVKLVTN